MPEGRLLGRRYRVSGVVQGVGFRAFVRSHARGLGLVGSVRNLEDGSVEVVAFGSESGLGRLYQLLGTGPAWSQVLAVNVADVSDETPASKTFDIM